MTKLAEPILAEVLPTTAGVLEYADEALEKVAKITVAAANANKPVLRAAASVTPNANIGVTALTESAVQRAEKAVGGLIAQNINQANAAVKNALNLNFNITQAPIVIGVGEFDKLVNTALDAQRKAYAAYLATLAKEAQRISSTTADNKLSINNFVLSNGYFAKVNNVVSEAEVFWYDGNIQYRLSNNATGVFNEINVFDKSKTNSFLGQFVSLNPVANNCSSQGADNKLGFANAPSDFCGFIQATSSMSSVPNLARELYIFDSANGETVTITVGQNTLLGVSVQKSDKYVFACGLSTDTPCQNTVFSNQTNYKEFSFANTVLEGMMGSTQKLTLKNGSLMHQLNNTVGGFTINTQACGTANTSCQSGVINDFAAITLRNGANNSVCTISKVNGSLVASNGGNTVSAALNGDATDSYVNAGVAHVVNATNRSPVNGVVVDTVQINWGASGINAVTVNAQDNTIKFVCVP